MLVKNLGQRGSIAWWLTLNSAHDIHIWSLNPFLRQLRKDPAEQNSREELLVHAPGAACVFSHAGWAGSKMGFARQAGFSGG